MSLPEFKDVPADLFLGGQWRPSSTGARFPVEDPASGETLVEVAAASADDAVEAVTAADNAGEPWAATAPRERAEMLRRAFEIMTDEADAFARLIVRENGKSLSDAQGEVRYAAEFFRWYSEEAVRIDGGLTVAPSGANRQLVVRQPIGVSLLITPWNFPAAMATRKIGPALAAGCTVILKPASYTPLTSLAIADVLKRAGAPDGTVSVLPARGAGGVVEAMLSDARVRKLSFTGSTEVGRLLLRQAADRIVTCSMELGGNAPFLVFDDADLDEAVQGAMVAKMRNGGASCIAANRFIVQETVADEFARRLADALSGLRVGPGLDPATDVGALVSEAERDGIAELVDQGVEDGAALLLGGRPVDRPGWFYPPTVLGAVQPDNRMVGEEIFGPVAPVMAFSTTEKAIELANDTPFGLAAYVFTRDLAKGLAVSEAIDTGMVGLNRGFISDPAAPFGGVKESGIGREGGHDGLLEFCETKYIAADW